MLKSDSFFSWHCLSWVRVMTAENLKILRTDLSRLMDSIKQFSRISDVGFEIRERKQKLQFTVRGNRMGEKKTTGDPQANSSSMPVINLKATQSSEYCLIPVILKCLTTSGLRVPAIRKDAALPCCNTHRDHRSCVHIKILATPLQKRQKPDVPDEEEVCPAHHTGKGFIWSKEKQSRVLSQALYLWEFLQPVLLKKHQVKRARKSNASLAITHRCTTSLPRRLIQSCRTVKIISCWPWYSLQQHPGREQTNPHRKKWISEYHWHAPFL